MRPLFSSETPCTARVRTNLRRARAQEDARYMCVYTHSRSYNTRSEDVISFQWTDTVRNRAKRTGKAHGRAQVRYAHTHTHTSRLRLYNMLAYPRARARGPPPPFATLIAPICSGLVHGTSRGEPRVRGLHGSLGFCRASRVFSEERAGMRRVHNAHRVCLPSPPPQLEKEKENSRSRPGRKPVHGHGNIACGYSLRAPQVCTQVRTPAVTSGREPRRHACKVVVRLFYDWTGGEGEEKKP